ncbi:hypothetical protein M445_10555 [Vibrio owensii 47666-1]|nr:hypothetical protein C1N50_25180 [Vibrio campbellii]KIF48712.1 hypothetical protein M445_10555 [Vibrio owensii 47666-1]
MITPSLLYFAFPRKRFLNEAKFFARNELIELMLKEKRQKSPKNQQNSYSLALLTALYGQKAS